MSQNCAVMLSRNRARRDEGALHVSTLSGSRPGALAMDGSAKQAEPAAYLDPPDELLTTLESHFADNSSALLGLSDVRKHVLPDELQW